MNLTKARNNKLYAWGILGTSSAACSPCAFTYVQVKNVDGMPYFPPVIFNLLGRFSPNFISVENGSKMFNAAPRKSDKYSQFANFKIKQDEWEQRIFTFRE